MKETGFKSGKLVLATLLCIGAPALCPSPAPGQIADSPDDSVAGIPVNYTEAKAGGYTLPDPLKLGDGRPVLDADTWFSRRRPEILHLFEENQFGRAPGRPADMTFDVFDRGTAAFGGKAIRKQVTIHFTKDKTGNYLDLLVYLPADAKGPVPLLLSLGWSANNLAVRDPGVKMGRVWDRRQGKRVPADGAAGFGRLDVLPVLEHGFGVATFNYTDVDPDAPNAVRQGIRGHYLKAGQTAPAPDEWGSIAAWAWGVSRVVDYFETDPQIDDKRIAVMGVSRLGKTVLWAGAADTRIALIIASCSGEGGAALSRRNYGETIAHLTAPTRYPYQFCANYQKWGDRVNRFPVDAHMLLALIAPRPVLLQTGSTDKWSDPYGEFLAAVAAEPVYRLLGKEGLGTKTMPEPGESILHDIGYTIHKGGHGTLPADWDAYFAFLEKHLKP